MDGSALNIKKANEKYGFSKIQNYIHYIWKEFHKRDFGKMFIHGHYCQYAFNYTSFAFINFLLPSTHTRRNGLSTIIIILLPEKICTEIKSFYQKSQNL